jgi:hypothetical protein
MKEANKCAMTSSPKRKAEIRASKGQAATSTVVRSQRLSFR